MARYSVNLWGSHPNQDNDDCWTGDDFDNIDQARAAFDDIAWAPASCFLSTQWVILDGDDGTYQERRNPAWQEDMDVEIVFGGPLDE